MSIAGAVETAAGLLLLFFAPGFFLAKAVFPEWRVRGAEALTRAVELGTLGFVLSIGLTVVIGYGFLAIGPSGFEASWSDPGLEVALALVAGVAFGAGWLRGAYRREPPPGPAAPEAPGPWALTQELDRLASEERRIRRRLTHAPPGSDADRELRSELARVTGRAATLRAQREAEYAQ